MICSLCPRRCHAVRDERGGGVCGAPKGARLARAALHFGEEPCISGTRGSGALFFSGCPLHCRFCQNEAISQRGFGKTVTAARLAAIFRELEAQGAHNLNLVSPTPYVPVIRQALRLYTPSIPIVYNTSGYERLETLRALDGVVDVYLPDLKYPDNELALALSGVSNYVEVATAAVLEMARQTGPMQLDADGIATRGTMVRHLVLPGQTRRSIAVLDWLADNLPRGSFVSLMFQYTPVRDIPGFPALSRTLTRRERDKVWEHLLARDLTDGYVQETGSAKAAFIPKFDLTGV